MEMKWKKEVSHTLLIFCNWKQVVIVMQNYPDCLSALNSAGDPFTLRFSLLVHNQTQWWIQGLLKNIDCGANKHEPRLEKQDECGLLNECSLLNDSLAERQVSDRFQNATSTARPGPLVAPFSELSAARLCASVPAHWIVNLWHWVGFSISEVSWLWKICQR